MGRPRLLDDSGGIYHVTSRGNNKAFIFREACDFDKFLDIILRYKNEMAFQLFHHVIMGNHFHFVIRPGESFSLSQIMQRILLTYSLYYKKRYGFIGQLWQGRFHSKIIHDEGYLLACGIYDELNPVRAGITVSPEKYPWSSYAYYAYGKPNQLTDPDPLYETLGSNVPSRQRAYRAVTKIWQTMPRPVLASP